MVYAKGVNGQVDFDGQFVTIERKGFLARASLGKGGKRLAVSAISAVQFKPADMLVRGFIQFTLPGAAEQRSRFGRASIDAAKDENAVLFTPKQQPEFEALRAAVEQAVAQRGMPQQAPGSVADELAKLAGLVQQGLLTQQEFEARKARLLAG